jgi:hypothetical protein
MEDNDGVSQALGIVVILISLFVSATMLRCAWKLIVWAWV